jgi:hypothetical protein
MAEKRFLVKKMANWCCVHIRRYPGQKNCGFQFRLAARFVVSSMKRSSRVAWMTSISARGLLCPLIARHSTVHDGTASVDRCHWSVRSRALSWSVVLSKCHGSTADRQRAYHLSVDIRLPVHGAVLDLLDWCAEILF